MKRMLSLCLCLSTWGAASRLLADAYLMLKDADLPPRIGLLDRKLVAMQCRKASFEGNYYRGYHVLRTVDAPALRVLIRKDDPPSRVAAISEYGSELTVFGRVWWHESGTYICSYRTVYGHVTEPPDALEKWLPKSPPELAPTRKAMVTRPVRPAPVPKRPAPPPKEIVPSRVLISDAALREAMGTNPSRFDRKGVAMRCKFGRWGSNEYAKELGVANALVFQTLGARVDVVVREADQALATRAGALRLGQKLKVYGYVVAKGGGRFYVRADDIRLPSETDPQEQMGVEGTGRPGRSGQEPQKGAADESARAQPAAEGGPAEDTPFPANGGRPLPRARPEEEFMLARASLLATDTSDAKRTEDGRETVEPPKWVGYLRGETKLEEVTEVTGQDADVADRELLAMATRAADDQVEDAADEGLLVRVMETAEAGELPAPATEQPAQPTETKPEPALATSEPAGEAEEPALPAPEQPAQPAEARPEPVLATPEPEDEVEGPALATAEQPAQPAEAKPEPVLATPEPEDEVEGPALATAEQPARLVEGEPETTLPTPKPAVETQRKAPAWLIPYQPLVRRPRAEERQPPGSAQAEDEKPAAVPAWLAAHQPLVESGPEPAGAAVEALASTASQVVTDRRPPETGRADTSPGGVIGSAEETDLRIPLSEGDFVSLRERIIGERIRLSCRLGRRLPSRTDTGILRTAAGAPVDVKEIMQFETLKERIGLAVPWNSRARLIASYGPGSQITVHGLVLRDEGRAPYVIVDAVSR